MTGERFLRCVGMTVLVVVPLATLSAPPGEESADSICSKEIGPAAPTKVRYYEALSTGGKVIGAPLHVMRTRFTGCHLARWNDPFTGMLRMIVFVYNDSNRAILKDARLTVWAESVPARVTSGPVQIGPKRTGIFLFVGPLQRIALGGVYGGRNVRFEERAPPAKCSTMAFRRALEVIEAFDEDSTLRSSMPNLDLEANVGIIRIQFDDSILAKVADGQATTEHLVVQLYENKQDAAFIECS